MGQGQGARGQFDEDAAPVPGVRPGGEPALLHHGLHHPAGGGIVHPDLPGQGVEGGRALLVEHQHHPELLGAEAIGGQPSPDHLLEDPPDGGGQGSGVGIG